MIQQRKLDVDRDFRFDAKGAVITSAPKRFMQTKQKNNKVFIGRYNKQGLVVNWTMRDILQLEDTSQSHLKSIEWAHNIIDNLSLVQLSKESFLMGNKQDKKIRGILTSLFSSLFNSYNPIFHAKRKHEKDSSTIFVKALVNVLNKYDDFVPELVDMDIKKLRQDLPGLSISNSNELENLLASLLNKERAKQIHQAAKAVGKAVQLELSKYLSLDFVELTIGYINSYFGTLPVQTKITDSVLNEYPEIHKAIFDNTLVPHSHIEQQKKKGVPLSLALDSKNSKKSVISLKQIEKDINQNGPFSLNPLHVAVMIGNVAFVNFLVEKNANLSAKANGEITALHFAVLYSKIHGNYPELVQAVSSLQTVLQDLIIFWLSNVENEYESVANVLEVEENELYFDEESSDDEADDNFYLDTNFSEYFLTFMLDVIGFSEQYQDDLLDVVFDNAEGLAYRVAFLIRAIREIDNSEFINAILNAGVDVNMAVSIEDRPKAGLILHTDTDSPLFEAIKKGNSALIKRLLKMGAETTEVYNQAGLPILLRN